MSTRATGGTVSVAEAERLTHAQAVSDGREERMGIGPASAEFACGANVGKLASGRPTCPRCLVRTMTLRDAQVELSNRVYEAAQLIELLEYAGKVMGNGHHMRQRLCQVAEALVAERWVAEKAVAQETPSILGEYKPMPCQHAGRPCPNRTQCGCACQGCDL